MKYRFRPSDENPFRSFLMAGFECADHQNAFGQRIDLTELTGHDRLIGEDYENLREIGIATVREGIRWSFVEKRPFEYDWSQVEDIIIHAQTHHIQVVWDICHFGFPDDLTPLHPMFARRFAHLCCAFVKKYRSMVTDGELIVTPINEVSFLSWLGGEVKGTSPYSIRQGWEVKYMLMKAYIEGIEMMKETDPRYRLCRQNRSSIFQLRILLTRHYCLKPIKDIWNSFRFWIYSPEKYVPNFVENRNTWISLGLIFISTTHGRSMNIGLFPGMLIRQIHYGKI
uniref:Amine oxidase n=1 Tax=Chryseobacterium endophyticum TaxID=1854762 RepID=A0AAU6WMK5_9FLAO